MNGLGAMPFLELLGNLILFAILIAILGVVLYWAGVALGIVFIATLVLGWIPILMCASDSEMYIQWDNAVGFWGFFERWAFLAMLEYGGTTVLIAVLSVVKPDPDGLPPAFKFLALFYIEPAAKYAYAATGQHAQDFDFQGFRKDMEGVDPSGWWGMVRARKLKKAQDAMERDRAKHDLERELTQAAVDLELAKEKRRAYEEALEEEERLKEFLDRHGR